jgi:hypothetical protein
MGETYVWEKSRFEEDGISAGQKLIQKIRFLKQS